MRRFGFNKKRNTVCMILTMLIISLSWSESEGEKAFKENRPEEAITLLEEEIKSGKASASAYNFLGLSYYQTGDYEKSVEVFSKGLKASGTNKKLLSFNQGNSYYALSQYEEAIKSYSLALTADSSFYIAILNKANANLMADKLEAALEDYKKYISVVTDDPQQYEIERLIEALTAEIARRAEEARLAAIEAERIAEEERRMAEELERQRIEEEKRLEAERQARLEQERKEREEREAREAEERRLEEIRRAEEAERRRKLLEEVANSLHNTDSTNMSSGAEDLIDYEQESELD